MCPVGLLVCILLGMVRGGGLLRGGMGWALFWRVYPIGVGYQFWFGVTVLGLYAMRINARSNPL